MRLLIQIFSTYNMKHPDEYYQGTEVAYKIVYGGNVKLPWEWSPEY